MQNHYPKILVVDDEPDVISYCQSYFGKRGYLVNTTISGRDAVSLVKLMKPDILILDRSIPDLNGMDVLKEVRTFNTKVKVIILTGHSLVSEEEREKFFRLDISAYMEKPVVLADLETIVARIFGHVIKPVISSEPKKALKSKKEFPVLAHTIKNLLGNLRSQCEVYLLNKKDGLYALKSQEELEAMADAILSDTIKTVDQTIKLFEKSRKK